MRNRTTDRPGGKARGVNSRQRLASQDKPGQHPIPLPAGPNRLLTASEAAKLLAVSERTVWRLRSTGVLPVVRIYNAIRFRLSDVQAIVHAGVERTEAMTA